MTFDLWTHQYCLACDKQVQSDGAAYCSEACRLADDERTSTPSSQASSPGPAPAGRGYPWITASPTLSSPMPIRNKFCLPPACDFYSQPRCGAAPRDGSMTSKYTPSSGEQSTSASVCILTPSSSHSSLCSMQSTASTEATHLSDRSRQELKAYAISFEQVRLQRRRSY